MHSSLKADINKLVDTIIKSLNIEVDKSKLRTMLIGFYARGQTEMELRFNMNFTLDKERLNGLTQYSFDNIKGLNTFTKEALRKELSQGLLNLENPSQLKDRVMEVMDTTKMRATMIARTEANRALNMGHIDSARQSGLKLHKEWVAAIDDRTSAICKDLNGKRLPLSEKFMYKGQPYDAPPAHPSCRSRLIFVQV